MKIEYWIICYGNTGQRILSTPLFKSERDAEAWLHHAYHDIPKDAIYEFGEPEVVPIPEEVF